MSACLHRLTDGREIDCSSGELFSNGVSNEGYCFGSHDWAQRLMEIAPLIDGPVAFNTLLLCMLQNRCVEIDRLQEDLDHLRFELLSTTYEPSPKTMPGDFKQ